MMKETKPKREQLRAAFLAGFYASGEGWNGEYLPDEQLGQPFMDWTEAQFDTWLAEQGLT
jgi:hypothetical protein